MLQKLIGVTLVVGGVSAAAAYWFLKQDASGGDGGVVGELSVVGLPNLTVALLQRIEPADLRVVGLPNLTVALPQRIEPGDLSVVGLPNLTVALPAEG